MKKWSELPKVSSVLVIAPHPDDEVIACGGLICEFLRRNISVAVLYVTGDSVRKAEALHGLEIFGEVTPSFLNLRDGDIEERSLAKGISLAINTYKPELILSPSKEDFHKDHSTVASVVLSAARDMPTWLYTVWGSPCSHANRFFDVSPFFERKLRALRRHISQKRDFDLLGLCRSHNHYIYLVNGGKLSDGYAECFTDLQALA